MRLSGGLALRPHHRFSKLKILPAQRRLGDTQRVKWKKVTYIRSRSLISASLPGMPVCQNVSDGTTYLCIGVKRFHKRLLSTEFVDEDSRGNHALGLVVWVFGSQFFFLFLAVAV